MLWTNLEEHGGIDVKAGELGMLSDEHDELRPRENDGVGGEDPLQVMIDVVVPQIQYNGQQDHDGHLD